MWVRQLTYLAGVVMLMVVLLLLANRHSMIYLDDYLPASLTPAFFQPPSDSFIIDVALESCLKINSKTAACGVPSENSGPLGNLYLSGGWVKIDKDLKLGDSWISKTYFSYKKAKSEALRGKIIKPEADDSSTQKRAPLDPKDSHVIVDIAIFNPKVDNKIKGNSQNLPVYILNEFHNSRVFGPEDHEFLTAQGKAELGGKKVEAVTLDKDKTASSKAHKLKVDLEKGQQQKEQELPEKTTDFEENIFPESPSPSLVIQFEQGGSPKVKRIIETSRHALEIAYIIPTKKQVTESGWRYKSNGIWLKYGPSSNKNAITGIDVLFGSDSVEPRPNWKRLPNPLRDTGSPSDKLAYLTIRRGPKVDYKAKEYRPTLKVNNAGKFKILQVADLHFSTGMGKCLDPAPASTKSGCQADPRTLKFLEKVLDIEDPDLVVLTGDQIFGQESPDAETSIFKALNPFIQRKIPFAVVLGNHDDEGSLSRSEAMSLSANLPFSLAAVGPEEVAGFGNYVVNIEGQSSRATVASLFLLDSHTYSKNPKVTPGYDWIKESQLKWLEQEAAVIKKADDEMHLSMGFFHIPLPEYRNLEQPFVGSQREAVIAPRYNTGARAVLGKIGVQVVSVGHDHCNDYCLQDVAQKDTAEENKIWLCYGGGSGEGGYGGYGGYVRRLRVFELDTANGDIKSWKRTEQEPEKDFDHQMLVSGGSVVNF